MHTVCTTWTRGVHGKTTYSIYKDVLHGVHTFLEGIHTFHTPPWIHGGIIKELRDKVVARTLQQRAAAGCKPFGVPPMTILEGHLW